MGIFHETISHAIKLIDKGKHQEAVEKLKEKVISDESGEIKVRHDIKGFINLLGEFDMYLRQAYEALKNGQDITGKKLLVSAKKHLQAIKKYLNEIKKDVIKLE